LAVCLPRSNHQRWAAADARTPDEDLFLGRLRTRRSSPPRAGWSETVERVARASGPARPETCAGGCRAVERSAQRGRERVNASTLFEMDMGLQWSTRGASFRAPFQYTRTIPPPPSRASRCLATSSTLPVVVKTLNIPASLCVHCQPHLSQIKPSPPPAPDRFHSPPLSLYFLCQR
jgi:hypothetical protein